MDKESYIINSLKNEYIGDDGAVIGKYVYSKDIFAQDVHFKLKWLSLEQIAKKAMLVNISDAIAMNAKPLYALIGISIPKNFTYKQIKKLTNSFKLTCKEYGIKIIGGDTTSASKLFISITIISKTKKPLLRVGLKKDDLLAYTGNLGESLKGLNMLKNNQKLSPDHRFVKPTLRQEFIKKATKFLSCGLDISDGLGKDLSRLANLNNLGVKFLCHVNKDIICSGEEYEMLIAFSKKHAKDVQKIAKKTNTPLNIFAKAVAGEYKNPCKEHHFA